MQTAISARPDASERDNPRVSVVIPAYNRQPYIGLTIESVLAQTFEPWELIVYDDGSTDGTLEVANSYKKRDSRIRVATGANGGVAMARNRGFALTDQCAEFVIFLDSDDLWEPDALSTLVAMLDAHPEYVASHGLARCIDAEGRPLPDDDLEERSRDRCGFHGGHLVHLAPSEPTSFCDLVYHYWPVTPGTQLLRRDVVARVGGFDPATDPADDADLAIRVSRYGDAGYVDRSLLRWRRHPETLTNTSSRWSTAARRVRAKTLTDPSNTPAQRQAMRLAYVHGVRSMMHDGRDAVTRRAYKDAFHHLLKSGRLFLSFVHASLELHLHHRRAERNPPSSA
jgi:glycosyltransferase involved in cell wall biosynthesis